VKPKRDERAEACQQYYDILIVALRYAAFRYGYALAVHGSLKRDIDLIACPWRDSAPGAHSLAAEIKKVTAAIIGTAREREVDPNPSKMPCGRLAWSFYLTHEDAGPYIDLSVMPMGATEAEAPQTTPEVTECTPEAMQQQAKDERKEKSE
jgi:hypothetical protein